MKSIQVVAAVLLNGDRVFATQRGYGEFKDGWEFPGGKIEPGETPQQALVREIKEELDTEIEVGSLLETVEHDYPQFHLTMHCFWCSVKSGDLVLKEHEAAKWLTKEELDSVEWLPADRGVAQKIKAHLEAGELLQKLKPTLNVIKNVSVPKLSSETMEALNIATRVANEIKMVLQPIQEQIQHVSEWYSAWYASVGKEITQTLSQLKIPELSEKRKKEICESYEQWGKYGWSILPNAPFKLFAQRPANQKEANRIALGYCKKDDIEYLSGLLLEGKKGSRKSDLEEALFDFENRKYKSCAMILFALIDSELIRRQNKKEGNRLVGERAGNRLFQEIEDKTKMENYVYSLFAYKNILACFHEIFAKGNNFVRQPDVINRNFLSHGMMTGRVSRKDCVQLFLLYYNLLELLDNTKEALP